MPTEDGWEPSPRIELDSPLLVWRQVPETDVWLQVRDDDAGKIMIAYAWAYNKYVEPLRDPDSACYTPTNSVDTSNHLNATASDFNWNTHPFRTRNTFTADQRARHDKMLDYFPMFWAGRWDDPVDEMHHQLDYGTWPMEQDGRLSKWVKAHILPDGTCDYSPDHAPAPPAPPPPPDAKDIATQVLYEAVEAFDMDDAAKWVDEIMMGLTLSRCNTPNRIAGWLAEMGEESGDFVYLQEIQPPPGAQYPPYIGRTWIQITWQENYALFGKWCVSQNLITDPNLFVNNPVALADPHWAAIGPAWYWTVARPTINSLCDQGDITAVTRLINGNRASQETIDSRNDRYAHANALGDRLKALIEPAIVTGPSSKPGGPLDALTPEEQHRLLDDVAEIRKQLAGDWPQNGNDPKAAADLDKRKANGEKLTPNDILCWIKNHASTHKNPTP
jgi:predicted chitinase